QGDHRGGRHRAAPAGELEYRRRGRDGAEAQGPHLRHAALATSVHPARTAPVIVPTHSPRSGSVGPTPTRPIPRTTRIGRPARTVENALELRGGLSRNVAGGGRV